MNRTRLSELPGEDLVLLIQQGSQDPLLWSEFLGRWDGPAMRYLLSAGVPQADAQDVVATFNTKVWLNLAKFKRRGDGSLRGWLYTILKRSLLDHWREQNKIAERLSSISLDETIELEDGSSVTYGEVLASNSEADLQDHEQREEVISIAEECLQRHSRQLELVIRRMRNEPLPSEWGEDMINSAWHRAKSSLLRHSRKMQMSK